MTWPVMVALLFVRIPSAGLLTVTIGGSESKPTSGSLSWIVKVCNLVTPNVALRGTASVSRIVSLGSIRLSSKIVIGMFLSVSPG